MKNKDLLKGPDGAPFLPYKKSNISVIEKFGKMPGKNIVVLGGVHGNEVCGVKVLKKLIPILEIIKGKVTFIFANLKAIKQNKRFIEQNLNRCFLKNQSNKIRNSLEGKTAREIMPYLDEADLMLDIHASFTPKSIPFVICQPQSFEFAEVMPFNIISWNWDEFEPGSTDYYINLQNKIGICAECGYLGDPESKKRAETALINFLAKAGAINTNIKEVKEKKFYKIVNLYKNKNTFKKTKNFSDFEKMKKKIIVGYDGKEEVYAEKGSYLLFARNSKNIGEECFLIAKETLLNSNNINGLRTNKEYKMKQNKIEIRPFRFGDYIRFLKVRLSPRTRKEFARSILGYFIVALKDVSSRIKAYKFSVYYNDRFVGFAGIFNDKGFDEIAVFILPEYRGKGIATRTTKELIDYSFTKLKFKKISAVTDELRLKLENILKKFGFKLVKRSNKIKIWEIRNKTLRSPRLGQSREIRNKNLRSSGISRSREKKK